MASLEPPDSVSMTGNVTSIGGYQEIPGGKSDG
jgi:hypothetical protein